MQERSPPSANDLVGLTRWQRIAAASTVALLVGAITLFLSETMLGFVPAVATILLSVRGRTLHLVQLGILTAFVCALLTLLVVGRQPTALDAVLFLGASLCTVLASALIPIAVRPLDAEIGRRRDPRQASANENSQLDASEQRAMAFAESRAFWTDVAQVLRFRSTQADGESGWSELRAEPHMKSSLHIPPLAPTMAQRDLDPMDFGKPHSDAIAAARTIENLFGNGWAFGPEGNWIYLPIFAQSTLGVTPEELNASRADGGIAWKRLLHPEEYDRVAAAWQHSLDTGEPFNSEFRIKRKTGFAWARTAARAARSADGKITGWYGTSIDIDVHRKTVDALRDREQELLEIVNFVPSNLWRLQPDGEPTFFNKPMVEFLGMDVGELDSADGTRLEAMIRLAVHPEDQQRFSAELAQSLSNEQGFSSQYRLRRHDGVYRWMSSRAAALHDRNGRLVQWNGLCLDIDDQVRAEEALKRSEWHLQQLIDALPVHVCSWTPEGELLYVSRRYLDELGLSTVNLSEFAKTALEYVHPEDVGSVEASLRDVEGGRAFSIRYRRKIPDGGYRWTDGRFEPLRDEAGHITEWFGLSIDVDDEMAVQEALRENERSLKELVETLPTMIYCATTDGKPIYRSRKLQEFLGFGIEDKDGLGGSRLEGTLDAIIHPDDLDAVRQRYGYSLRTGEPYVMKHRLRRYDGEYRWVETRTAAMRNTDGAIIQWNGVCVDIDDWVRDQEQLGLAQRNLARASQAASLAELTASIAHEVGQPLAAVVSSSDASHRWLSADPPNVERALKALERVMRSAETTMDVFNRVRALFKHSNDAKQPSSIKQVVGLARELLAEDAIRRDVRLDVTIEPDLPSIALDRVQIQQVLVNLMRNGLEAGYHGTSRARLSIDARREGAAIQIAVRDNGPGLVSTDRVFEPFFTTKADGMGMGLAICKSIVEAHGGRLWAEASEPTGAAFIFTLPFGAVVPEPEAEPSGVPQAAK